ncbi:hypothetical protein MPOCJGCO_2397 [Methylobacterium trifolii]|uniref:Uncharacterized protein n=1 Tax=Methylobacterium trifolii TaxID=1003092 RepID=A0ABQ4TYF7_9HYPH|nr:hypothetical protein MPOCJGCO_2397 [Methylobacterium trifolii]
MAAVETDAGEFRPGLLLEGLDLGVDHLRAVEDVVVFEEIGLEGEDLLHAHRPLLVPGPRQAERLVPGRQLHGARAGALGERHGQHLDQDAVDVVLGLLLGEPEGVHLDAVAKDALLRVGDAVALLGDLVPEFGERPHLADLGDEPHPGVHEERDAAEHVREARLVEIGIVTHRVEHGDGDGQRVGQLLHRRRARLLQVVGADVHRVPLRHLLGREQDHVLGQPKAGCRREHVGPAREILLDDVVLRGALEAGERRALLLGHREVEGQQPRRCGVNRHRGVHLDERDVLEQGPHVAQMRDRDPDLADLAPRQLVVRVVAGLRRQVEGDRESGLSLGEVAPIEGVRLRGVGMARIGADDPRLVALRLVALDLGDARAGAHPVRLRHHRLVRRRCARCAAP